MIVVKNFIADFLIHSIVLLVVGLYIQSISRAKGVSFFMVSIFVAFLLTLLNHSLYPNLTVSTLLTTNEGYPPYNRPSACPCHANRCPYAQSGKCPCMQ